MDEFTEKERKTINDIYRREFQDMTPDEVQLLLRWNTAQAKNDELVKAEIAAMNDEKEARIEETRKTAEKARRNLAELKSAAKKRLAAIEG
jgi:hypothetical protein